MNPFNVLVKPLLSEKSNRSRENNNQYVFMVQRDADKEDIKKAVERVFSVKVTAVNTMIIRGKVKRRGNHVAKLPNTKKALISLAEGSVIKLFEDL